MLSARHYFYKKALHCECQAYTILQILDTTLLGKRPLRPLSLIFHHHPSQLFLKTNNLYYGFKRARHVVNCIQNSNHL